MKTFPDLLENAICFEKPRRLTDVSSWHGHIPFAFSLVRMLRPTVFVELGIRKGDAYCAFCQAVEMLGLNCACHAIDPWEEDVQAGFYGKEVFEEFRAYHDPLYGDFSTLLPMRFDEALERFPEGSIDLLHIDGFHTYDAAKHDFLSWLPKMSHRGVVLLHDTHAYYHEFEVWKLWKELREIYPSFEFTHSQGLGILGVGKDLPDDVGTLLNLEEERANHVRRFFSAISEDWSHRNFSTPLTDRSRILDLIQKLHPIAMDMELIRLGAKHDGGYLVPNDLEGIEACFSPGVGEASTFEKDCANLGMQVFLADRSVEHPAESHDRFNFTQKYVGALTSDEYMTMDDWVASTLPESQSDLLLQIDTEGYEYETFLNISEKLMQRLRIIVAEFHGLDRLWSLPFFTLASRAFEKILRTHACVHIHPNNHAGFSRESDIDIPQVMEFTFLRRDRIRNIEKLSFVDVFPHPLDSDNAPDPTSLHLPDCWYRRKD
uniref:Methyltransferase FkbM domain-containing protein n=1 Tax=Candidatus Kentrum sp. DK TaxID=2126562 RepID=A0A450SX66_9GAMM|nr:MAG: Methyltransferase FkbM domain-containing protein [Candidatus Kentron sp. DK]